MKKGIEIILGAILIAAGVIYILGAFGIADIHFSFDGWWAFFIIVPCFCGLLKGEEKFRNFVGLMIGVLLLLAAQNIIEYAMVWKVLVPGLIIMLGIKLIVKTTATPKAREEKENMAAFCTRTVDYTDEEITVAKIGAVFGGATCNLTDAKIQDGSQIAVFCAFGGADIIVPENVRVKINAFCLFGGISDKRAGAATPKEGATLVVNGFCLFGGADIKNSKMEK